MARIRTIKPDFFTSQDIVSLSPLARLLYIALWCEADREGRLTWRPGTLKLRYLPGDAATIEAVAAELIERDLVRLYGQGFAHIPTFLLHQHVNPREQKSLLPTPPEPVDNQKTQKSYPQTDASSRVTDASIVDNSTRQHASNLDLHAQGGKEGKEGKEGNDASRRVDESKAVDKSRTAKPKPNSPAPGPHCSYCEKPHTATVNGLRACEEHFANAMDNERPGTAPETKPPSHARAQGPTFDPDQGYPVRRKGKFDDEPEVDSQKLSGTEDRQSGT